MTAPIASGGSEFAGWALHPLESAALPRRTPIPVIDLFDLNRYYETEGGSAGGPQTSRPICVDSLDD